MNRLLKETENGLSSGKKIQVMQNKFVKDAAITQRLKQHSDTESKRKSTRYVN